MPAVYSIDLIAKRDKKLKMDRSIVKGWNVHYQTLKEAEEAARLKKQRQEEEMQAQNHSEDEEAEGGEPDQEAEEVFENSEAAFNRKTGSYSGHYGKRPVHDEREKKQIHAILEKPDAFSAAMSALNQQAE